MYNSVIECVKVSNIFIGLKKTCLGLLERCDSIEDIKRVIRSKKITMAITTVLPLRDARSLRLIYLPVSETNFAVSLMR